MAARRSTKRHHDVSSSLEPEDREPLIREKRVPFLDRELRRESHEYIAFDSKFVKAMLSNVKVLTIGDSLMRGMYKDLITWLQSDQLSSDADMKAAAEATYKGDRQIDISLLTDDKVFRQAREYQTDRFLLQFQFTTRVMKDDMETLVQQMLGEDGYPDVILINSMIWDLTRYFKVSTDTAYSDNVYQKRIETECLQKYLDRTSMLLRRLRAILPPHTMVLWVCFPHCRPSLPRGAGRGGGMQGRGGGMQFQPLAHERNHFIRSVMIDGSFRIAQVVRNAGYDVLDLGFYMRNHAFYHYQKDDGMHWLPAGIRLMSQLFIQFLAKSWGIDTSIYFRKLEERQSREALKVAVDQLKTYAFYGKEVPKMHDQIAIKTFEKLSLNQQSWIQDIIMRGRTLTPFVQAVHKYFKRTTSNRFNPNPRQSYVQHARVAPRIDRQTVYDVDNLAMQLLAITKTVKNAIREDSRK